MSSHSTGASGALAVAGGEIVSPATRRRAITAAFLLALGFLGIAFGLGRLPEQPTALQLSFVLGGAFGFVLQRSRFCFLCIWRDWLDDRDGRGLVGILAALAVGVAGYTLIYGAWLPDPSGTRLPPTAHIAPVGPVLVLAGIAFGAGTAISGSCISVHFYRIGEGSPTAPFAILGSLFGFWLGFSSWTPLYLSSISEAPILWLPRILGYGNALVLTLPVLAGLALLVLTLRLWPATSRRR